MLRFRKKREEKEIQDKIGEPFLIQDDRLIDDFSFSLDLSENPEVSYSMSAAKDSICGSYEINITEKIIRGPKKLINQHANININTLKRGVEKNYKLPSTLGYMGFFDDEGCLEIDVKLNVNYRYAADMLKFLYDYKPSKKFISRITIVFKNERRYNEWPRGFHLKDNRRKIIYDVLGMNCWHLCDL